MPRKHTTKARKEKRAPAKASASPSSKQPRELTDTELEHTAGGTGGGRQVSDCEGFTALSGNIYGVNKVDGFTLKQKI